MMMKRVLGIGVALLVALRLTDLGLQEEATRLENALTRIDEAQRKAGQLNQDANALAADAAKTIHDVLDSLAKR